jgi:hypothetical protein
MLSAADWTEREGVLPDGTPRVLRFIPTDDEKTATLKTFLELNISKGERKDKE